YSQVDPNKETTIAIMMGGAEHLGTLLRAEAVRRGLTRVRFVELFLTWNTVRPWIAETDDGRLHSHGIYDLPPGIKMIFTEEKWRWEHRQEDNARLEAYVNASGVFKGD